MSFVVDFHRDDTVLQFLELRRILEPAAAALAAQRMSDEDIDTLRSLMGELDDAPTLEALVANDLEFHRLLAVGSGNPVIHSLLESLSAPTTRARIWRGLTQEGAVTSTRQQHRSILEAVAARRPELAHAWATVHVAGVEDRLRRAL